MSALRQEASRRPYNRVRAAVRDGRIVLVKVCTACDREGVCSDAEESDYRIKTRHPDGRPRHWESRCKPCARAAQAERHERLMRTDPAYRRRHSERSAEAHRRWVARPGGLEKQRAASRRYKRQRRAADPEGVRELGRIDYALRQERAGKTVRRSRTVVDGTQQRVPAGPFRDWLRAYSEAYDFPSGAALAAALRMTPRRLRSVLSAEYARVSLDVVDGALTAALGRPDPPVCVGGREVLRTDDLYPLRG